MSTPLFLLIGLTIATCVIAYWSDNLGKKLGKKRVSLFGLRPRQTATLMTMTSSVLIMLFTLGVLLATNSGLRGALLRYDKERADNRELRQNNQNLRREQVGLQKDVANAQNAANAANEKASNAKKQEQDAHQKYAVAQKDLVERQSQLSRAQNAEKIAHSGEKRAQIGEKRARQRAERIGQQLQAKQQELSKVDGELDRVQVSLGTLKRNLKIAQADLKIAQNNTKTAQMQEKRANQAAVTASESAYRASRDLLDDIGRLQNEKQSLETNKQELEANKQELEAGIRQLELIKNQLATQETDVNEGVFADAFVPVGTDATQAAKVVRELLAEGLRVISVNNSQRKLLLLLPNGKPVQESIAVPNLASYIATLKVPVSIRLVAVRSYAKAENDIQAVLMPVPARLVFERDAEIVSRVIDGSQSDARIFNQLVKLVDNGETVARAAGMMPWVKKDEVFYADGTNEQIFEALRRIQALGKPVNVKIVAKEKINAIERLQIRFEIQDVNNTENTKPSVTPS